MTEIGEGDPLADPIPDSAWEQKMAWAKERAAAGRQAEAVELYQELVQEDPTSVRALNNLGVLQDEMGDAEGAVATLRAAKEIEPTNQEILGNLGAALGLWAGTRMPKRSSAMPSASTPPTSRSGPTLASSSIAGGCTSRLSRSWRSFVRPYLRTPPLFFTGVRP